VCGRFVLETTPEIFADFFDAIFETGELEPSFNVAPTDPIYAVRRRKERRLIETMRWGLVPSWSKDTKGAAKLINARAETVAEAASFRNAFRARRCLIPADGFYEWSHRPEELKQPYYITRRDRDPLAFGGLWEPWKPKDQADAEWLISCTIITTEATADLEGIHDRQPLVLEEEDWALWLDSESELDQVVGVLHSAPEETLGVRPVSVKVNSVRNNSPDLMRGESPQRLF
jgi:putative SOS response-associated peptidase YedK